MSLIFRVCLKEIKTPRGDSIYITLNQMKGNIYSGVGTEATLVWYYNNRLF